MRRPIRNTARVLAYALPAEYRTQRTCLAVGAGLLTSIVIYVMAVLLAS